MAEHSEDCVEGWIDCWDCGGEGWKSDHEWDPINSDEDDESPCHTCDGNGGWHCPVCKVQPQLIAPAPQPDRGGKP